MKKNWQNPLLFLSVFMVVALLATTYRMSNATEVASTKTNQKFVQQSTMKEQIGDADNLSGTTERKSAKACCIIIIENDLGIMSVNAIFQAMNNCLPEGCELSEASNFYKNDIEGSENNSISITFEDIAWCDVEEVESYKYKVAFRKIGEQTSWITSKCASLNPGETQFTFYYEGEPIEAGTKYEAILIPIPDNSDCFSCP